MPEAWFINARSVQIAASILLAGIFAFEVVMLGPARRARSDDLNELERQFLQLALWSLVAVFLSALIWFSLELKSISGLSFAKAFSGPAWRTLLFAFAALTLMKEQPRRPFIPLLLVLSVFASSRSPGLATLRPRGRDRSVS